MDTKIDSLLEVQNLSIRLCPMAARHICWEIPWHFRPDVCKLPSSSPSHWCPGCVHGTTCFHLLSHPVPSHHLDSSNFALPCLPLPPHIFVSLNQTLHLLCTGSSPSHLDQPLVSPPDPQENAIIVMDKGPSTRCHILPGLTSLSSATCPSLQPAGFPAPPPTCPFKALDFLHDFLRLEYPFTFPSFNKLLPTGSVSCTGVFQKLSFIDSLTK